MANDKDMNEIDNKDEQEPVKTTESIFNLNSKQSGERNWYVIHTYSGYEDQVADNLLQRVETLGQSDKVFDVIVPKEKQIEIKGGKKKIIEKRIFPGYVLVDMIVTDDSWYVVRNTPNVTGFIGFGVRPTPMKKEEIERIKKRMGVDEPKYKIELKMDDLVRVNDGPLKGYEARVVDIDEDKGRIKVMVSMFGRDTPVTLDYLQVKKA
jgi:transcriptional antiterminator NusG